MTPTRSKADAHANGSAPATKGASAQADAGMAAVAACGRINIEQLSRLAIESGMRPRSPCALPEIRFLTVEAGPSGNPAAVS